MKNQPKSRQEQNTKANEQNKGQKDKAHNLENKYGYSDGKEKRKSESESEGENGNKSVNQRS